MVAVGVKIVLDLIIYEAPERRVSISERQTLYLPVLLRLKLEFFLRLRLAHVPGFKLPGRYGWEMLSRQF